LSFYLTNPYSHILKKELEEERLLYGKHSITLIPLEEPVRILKDQGLVPSGNGILEPIMPADLKINRTEHLNRYLILATKPK
jgi:hypothetical protein